MKKIYIIMMAAMLSLTTTKVFAETYEAWGKVSFMYISNPMYDAEETIEVNGNTITFTSDTWGKGTFNSETGEGTMTMSGHGEPKDYAATISGSVDDEVFTISLPSVMGGTTIVSTLGSMPVVCEVAASYKGGTYANAAYFQKYLPQTDQSVTITVNDGNETVTVTHDNDTWGSFTFTDVTVSKNTDGTYSLSGEGTDLMPGMNGGDATERAATFEGNISDGVLVATFSVPGVMGGTTVLFNPADFDEVYNSANSIASVKAHSNEKDNVMYSLSGTRVDASYKGMVIVNGRKYVNR